MPTRMIQIVEVVWVDSEAIAEWHPVSELTHTQDEIITVGMLIHSDKDVYLIASTYDSTSDSINAAIWIPRSCVRELRKLGAVKIDTEH